MCGSKFQINLLYFVMIFENYLEVWSRIYFPVFGRLLKNLILFFSCAVRKCYCDVTLFSLSLSSFWTECLYEQVQSASLCKSCHVYGTKSYYLLVILYPVFCRYYVMISWKFVHCSFLFHYLDARCGNY